MVSCAYCKKRSNMYKGLSFHKFPSKQEEKDKWVENMGRKNWSPSKNSVLCSIHFTPKCIDFQNHRARLRKGSIPTIFGSEEDTSAPKMIETFNEGMDSNVSNVRQQCHQATQPPVVTKEAVDNSNQVNAVQFKEEAEDSDMDIGPTILQHMDSQYRTTQTNIKREGEVHNGDDERGLRKVESDQVLHSQVTVELTEGSQKVVTESDHSQFKCDKCFKILPSKMALMKHRKQVHATDLFKCVPCNKEFKCKSYLANHVRYAHRDQEYECDVCKKMCESKEMLRKHVWSVHCDNLVDQNTPSFTGDYYKKTLSQKPSFEQHIKCVHGELIEQCVKCDKSFKSPINQSVHNKAEHKCGTCHKVFMTAHGLTEHMKSIHNSSENSDCKLLETNNSCPIADVDVATTPDVHQYNVVVVKEELADGKVELELDPILVQHTNDYQVCKEEPQGE